MSAALAWLLPSGPVSSVPANTTLLCCGGDHLLADIWSMGITGAEVSNSPCGGYHFPTTSVEAQALWAWVMDDLADTRVDGWPTMHRPYVNWALGVLYLAMVWLGPKLMKNRSAVPLLRGVAVAHNALMVALSVFLFAALPWEHCRHHGLVATQWVGTPVDYSEKGVGMARLLWLFYFSKLLEFMDTFLIIARKKLEQLTFLHVWHHSFMFFIWWIGTKYFAGGDSWFCAWVNCGVHSVMYAYYALTAARVPFPRKLKPLITNVQLGQFVLVMTHCLLHLYHADATTATSVRCVYPRWVIQALILFMLSLITLFSNFYYRTYCTAATAAAAAAKGRKGGTSSAEGSRSSNSPKVRVSRRRSPPEAQKME